MLATLTMACPPNKLRTVYAEVRSEHAGNLDHGMSAQQVAARIKALVGVSTRVVIVESGRLERSVGKARRVVDKRPRD